MSPFLLRAEQDWVILVLNDFRSRRAHAPGPLRHAGQAVPIVPSILGNGPIGNPRPPSPVAFLVVLVGVYPVGGKAVVRVGVVAGVGAVAFAVVLTPRKLAASPFRRSRFSGLHRGRMRGSAAAHAATASRDPSVEPSSTTSNSQSANVWARTERTARSKVAMPLYTGMTTDTSGGFSGAVTAQKDHERAGPALVPPGTAPIEARLCHSRTRLAILRPN
jgi:hypothetical protein